MRETLGGVIPWRGLQVAWRVALLTACCGFGSSCGSEKASLRVVATPNPVRVELVLPCSGVPAWLGCSAGDYLEAAWQLSVSATNGVGGRGAVSVLAVDASGLGPLGDPQATVSGVLSFAVAGEAGVILPIRWTRTVPPDGPGRQLPAQLAFLVTVSFSDSNGNEMAESVTIREGPREWHVY